MIAPNTRMQILKRLLQVVGKAVFVNYFYLTLVALGLGVTILSAIVPGSELQPTWWRGAAKSIGEAILVAGAVTTFMRFFASLDLVGERIEGWLTNETYLETLAQRLSLAVYEPHRAKNLGDLQLLWQRISLVMTRHAFPQIAESVYSRTLEQLITASSDYYFDRFSRTTEIRLVDATKGVVEVEHTIRCTVVANQNDASVLFRSRLLLSRIGEWEPQVLFFQVNGSAQTVAAQKAESDRQEEREFLLEAPLSAGQPVHVSYAYTVRQSLVSDPFVIWATTRYIRFAHHELRFPERVLDSTYQDTSFAALLVREPASKPGCLVYVSRPGDLLFPGSAFMFVLRIRSQPDVP